MPGLPLDGIPPPPDQSTSAPVEAPPPKGSRIGGVISTLLGWKHADELWKKEQRAAYLSHRIYSHINDPNDIQPDEDVDKKVNEFEKMIGSNGVVKNEVQAYRTKKLAQADYQNKVNLLAKPQQEQAPPQVPAQPQVAAPQAQAQPELNYTPVKPPTLPPPPGGPAPVPFGSGGPEAGSAPPLQNEPPDMAAASAQGGTGSGVMPPAPPAAAQQPYQSQHFLNANQQAERKANAAIAGQRITNAYDEERIQAVINRLDSIIGPEARKKLRPSQITDYITKGVVPELKGEKLGQGDIWVTEDGNVVSGSPKPITTRAGETTTIPAPAGGVAPGTRFNPNNPMQNAPAGISGAPDGTPTGTPGSAPGGPAPIGATTISGGPALSTAQQGANAWWASKHPGQPITPDKFAEAMSGFSEDSMSASAKLLRDAQITTSRENAKMRQIQEAHLRQTMMEFNRTKGPEAIDAISDQVRQNPELMQSLSPEVKNLVITAFPKKFGLPAPRPIPILAKNQEISSQLALSNVDAMREALKNPVVQQRIGSWNGRLGDIEQTFGTAPGLSAADSQAIQKFRSGLTYLFMTEGKALFAGRAPQALMAELKKTSPNVRMGMPMMLGSLSAVEDLANASIKNANDYRYGGAAMHNPPAGTPAHGIPDIGTTFNDGKVLRVTPYTGK